MSTLQADQPPAQAPPATAGFVHLHTHTEFSSQDGLARLDDVAARIATEPNPVSRAAAMTDHGNIGGAWRYVQACKKAGVKSILGIEAYLALVPDEDWLPFGPLPELPADAPAHEVADRAARDAGVPLAMRPGLRFARTTRMQPDAESGRVKRNTNNHLTILVKNETGWRNLCALTNAAERSFFHKPLIDYALLAEHSEGLIVLSGCLGGPVASQVAMARTTEVDEAGTPVATVWDEEVLDRARAALRLLTVCVPADADGTENVYVEVMEHGLEAEGRAHIVKLAELASQAGLNVVATNDSHFGDACDHEAHDLWLVNGERRRGNDITVHTEERWRFNGAGYWLRTEAEMRAIYPNATTWQRACDETVAIAARIDDEVIPFKALRLPVYPVPDDIVAEFEAAAASAAADPTGASRSYPTASAYYLHKLVLQGAKRKYRTLTPEVRERLRFEEDTITGLGLEDYFLIVWDALDWARSDRGLPSVEHPRGAPAVYDTDGTLLSGKKPIRVGPGRGSAAGSAISYCLNIVTIDPIRWGLLFERFLDISRVGMPDIDVDFESLRRSEIYAYVAARYDKFDEHGNRIHYTARIGAWQGTKSKNSIKDTARALGLTQAGEELAKLVPVEQGSPHPFSKLFEEDIDEETGLPISNPEAQGFRDLAAANADNELIVSMARRLEGVVGAPSIHAAGVIISDEPLNDLIPMRFERADGSIKSEVPVALWDGTDIDSFGMLKLDALSVDNLDFVSATVDYIAQTRGETVDPDDLPDPDDRSNPKVQAAFELLRAGQTEAIFQLESSGITELTMSARPTCFEDLSTILALYRPGPMGANMHNLFADRKNGRAGDETTFYEVYTADPAEQAVIKSVLGDTFGAIVFQEQLMSLAGKVAGFDAQQRSDLRKAVSKKKKAEIDRLRAIFMDQGVREMALADGTVSPAFSTRTLTTLWTTFQASAKYLFNKSHTAAYGYLSYVTAYLKANYPAEYGAAVLAKSGKADKRLAMIGSLARSGISLLPPDVNRSLAETAPDPDDSTVVLTGLGIVRDVGANGSWIVKERLTSQRPFADVADLMERVKLPNKDGDLTSRLPITAVESLIEAGGLDAFGRTRLQQMIDVRAASRGADVQTDGLSSQWTHIEETLRQRHRIGTSHGVHPTTYYAEQIAAQSLFAQASEVFDLDHAYPMTPLGEVASGSPGTVATVGMLTSWAPRVTRKGTKMANFVLEVEGTSLRGVTFARGMGALDFKQMTLSEGMIVGVLGNVKKTVRVTMTKDEEGNELEESREVMEFFADDFEVVQIDTTAHIDLPATPEDEQVPLAEVIDLFSRQRVADTSGPAGPDATGEAGGSQQMELDLAPRSSSATAVSAPAEESEQADEQDGDSPWHEVHTWRSNTPDAGAPAGNGASWLRPLLAVRGSHKEGDFAFYEERPCSPVAIGPAASASTSGFCTRCGPTCESPQRVLHLASPVLGRYDDLAPESIRADHPAWAVMPGPATARFVAPVSALRGLASVASDTPAEPRPADDEVEETATGASGTRRSVPLSEADDFGPETLSTIHPRAA